MSTVNSLALPTLSVILPNYNHARYLPYSLGAILGQSVRPLEVLVYDDGSTDDSLRVIREFAAKDPIVRLIADTRKAGPNANLNRGFCEAKGDFVYPAAADDQVLPGFFSSSLDLLARHPGAKLCLTDLAQFDDVTGQVRYLRPQLSPRAGYVTRDEIVQRLAHQHIHMYGGMAILNRTALLDIGGFQPSLKWYADWFCVLVLALRHGACYIPKAFPTMRMLPGSFSAAGSKDTAVQDALVRQIFDLLRSGPYADVWGPISKTGALCLLGSQILRVILTEARYRDLLSPRLLMRLMAHVPVTLVGLNPATPSPFLLLDRVVRSTLGLNDSIQKYGVQVGG